MPSVLRALLRVRRFLLIHRRGLAVLSLGLAVWWGLGTVHPPSAPTVELWTASHDLDGGTVLTSADLRRSTFLDRDAPPGVTDPGTAVGRMLATPLVRGEVLNQTQLMGGSRLTGYPGRAALGLRIPDADAGRLLHPGDRVDLVASDPQGRRPAELLVHDAAVLAVPAPSPSASSPAGTGVLVVFAVPSQDVVRVASVGSTLFLTPIWTR